MKKQVFENLLRSIFSIFIMIAIAGGVITFLLFVVAIIMGGDAGGQLAVNIKNIYLPYFIKAASIGVISGLILFYVSDTHALSLSVEKQNKEGK